MSEQDQTAELPQRVGPEFIAFLRVMFPRSICTRADGVVIFTCADGMELLLMEDHNAP